MPLEPGKVTFLTSSHISCSPSLTFDIACVDLKIKRSYLFSPSLECKCSMTFGTLIDLKESRICGHDREAAVSFLIGNFRG